MAIVALSELGSIWVGDVPPSPMRWDFIDENGDHVAIGDFDGWSMVLKAPDGTVLGTQSGTPTGNHLQITFTGPSLATVSGIYEIVFKFNNGGILTAEPYRFVVQAEDGWLTLQTAREQWPDAPYDEILLHQILDTAKFQCIAYAPVIEAGKQPPINYVQAQLMQARAIYQSVIANQNDNIGIEGFAVRVFPLDFTIRALLRPKRAIGAIF